MEPFTAYGHASILSNLIHMKPKPFDRPTLLVVVQKPFQAETGEFCKLAPLIYLDGNYPQTDDFRNDGEVWWMLTPRTRGFAEPGRIVVAQLEAAKVFDDTDPNKSSVQAKIDSIRDPGKEDVFQVIHLGQSEASSPQDFVESYRIASRLRHLGHMFVHWRSSFYGPFRAVEDGASTTSGSQYKLVPQDSTKCSVLEFAGDAFVDAVRIEKCRQSISKSAQRLSSSPERDEIAFEYFLASSLPRVLKSVQPRELVLEPIGAKLRKAASQYLVRKDAQQFKALLERIEQRANDQQAPADLVEAIRSQRSRVASDLEAMDTLAMTMLEQGLLGPDRLERMELQVAARYLKQHGAELKAKIDSEVASIRSTFDNLTQKCADLEAEIKSNQEAQRVAFQRELSEERTAALSDLKEDRKRLDDDRAEIEKQRVVLKGTFEEVTRNLREGGHEIIKQFLSLEPLLGHTFGPSRVAVLDSSPSPTTEHVPPRFQPAIRSRDVLSEESVSEAAFVDRVVRLAVEQGLSFRRIDVERFHLSVKTGEITVLCGPSGTGKSSLAMVYGEALRGAGEFNHESHLVVPVSPTWLDGRDLLGHVSAAERRFIPSESGLYEFLLKAQYEQRELNEAAGIALAILDEMNLSQVEHYFGDLLLALERKGRHRSIRCFSQNATLPSCPFHEHGRLYLAESLRIVGTVNFDETTRQFSDRFLDRTNLIYLSPGGISSEVTSASTVDCGRAITQRDFAEWSASRPLEDNIGGFVDEIYRLMERLAHPVSQRVRNDLYRYICTSGNLVTQSQATDHQVAQRVLSKLRMGSGQSQRTAFDSLEQFVESRAGDLGLPLTMSELHRIRSRLIEASPDED